VAGRQALLLGWVALAPVAGLPALFLVWVSTETGGLTGWRFAGSWSLAAFAFVLAAGSWAAVRALVRARALAAWGILLLLASSTWPVLVAADAVPDAVVPLIMATGLLVPAGLALMGGVGTRTRGVVLALASGAVVVHLAAYQPSLDPACELRCVGHPALLEGLTIEAARVSSAAAAIAVLLLLPHGLRAGTSLTVGRVVPLAAAPALVMYAARATAWGPSIASGPRLLLPLLPVLVVAGAVAWERLRSHRSQRLVTQLLEDLAAGRTPGQAGAWQFALPGRPDAWVDDAGEPIDTAPADVDLELRQASGEVIARRTATTPRQSSGIRTTSVRVEAAADRVLVENLRSAALSRADARDLAASRRRIVQAADAEARRIESDLHDGAQQIIVGASMHLGIAGRGCQDAGDRALLEQARAELRLALDGLREVAHGAFPRLLVADGVGAALRESASPPGVLRLVEDAWGTNVPLSVAVASYRLVRGVVDGADTTVSVRLLREPDVALTVEVRGRDVDMDTDGLQRAADRVGAVGGAVRLRRRHDGVTVEAVFPCGSS
jgi:hypothetical protein